MEQLLSGAFRSGDRIDHDQLGEALGTSRLPVREALVILERDGIASMKYHRGVSIGIKFESHRARSAHDDSQAKGEVVALPPLSSANDEECSGGETRTLDLVGLSKNADYQHPLE